LCVIVTRWPDLLPVGCHPMVDATPSG